MSTTQIAKWAAAEFEALPDVNEIVAALADAYDSVEYGNVFCAHDIDTWPKGSQIAATVYLGSVFALDPCGRYHHMLSPNGVTNRCIRFWESLERQLEARGLGMTSGEGDPCDVFASKYLDVPQGDDADA